MINGILKDNNSNEVQNYVSAKNVEINGMNLEDYLNKLKINLLEYISTAANPSFGANGQDITNNVANAHNFIKFRNIQTTGDIFSVNEDGNEITITKQLPSDHQFALIMMYNEFGNNSANGSIVNHIRIYDNSGTDIGTPSTCTRYFESGKRSSAFTYIPIKIGKNFRIKFECNSATDGTYWYRNNVVIIVFNNINSNLFSFPI